MPQRTGIEWTDYTSNPIKFEVPEGLRRSGIWGASARVNLCVPVSAGCAHCYAAAIEKRFHGVEYKKSVMEQARPHLSGIECERLLRHRPKGPFKNGPRPMYFVGDMTDVFGEWCTFDMLAELFDAMAAWRWPTVAAEREGNEEELEDPGHIYQVLTKRPERIMEFLEWMDHHWPGDSPFQVGREVRGWPENIWIGTSVEHQECADRRIPELLKVPAAVRFVSYEPALGPVDFKEFTTESTEGTEKRRGIDWVVAGGESGAGARGCNVEWIRSAVRQCRDAGVACFVKQLGSRPYFDSEGDVFFGDKQREIWKSMVEVRPMREIRGAMELVMADRKGGAMGEWPEDLRVREWPK